MSGLVTPEPGWIAMKMGRFGVPIALSLLGVAVTLHEGMASDDEIIEAMVEINNHWDPVYRLTEYYVDLEAAHPFLLGHLGVLTDWTASYTDYQAQALSDAAAILTTVAFSGAEPRAGGDLLGHVYSHMSTAGFRRSVVYDMTDVTQGTLMALAQATKVARMRSMADMWCGSGGRACGTAEAMRLLGADPAKVDWTLNDPSRMHVAMAGLNAVAYRLGEHVALMCDRALAERWAAVNADPRMLMEIPPEIARDVKALRGKRLG